MKNCPICGELITENAPTFKVSMGFGNFDIYDGIVIHRDCIEMDDPIRVLIDTFEGPDDV